MGIYNSTVSLTFSTDFFCCKIPVRISPPIDSKGAYVPLIPRILLVLSYAPHLWIYLSEEKLTRRSLCDHSMSKSSRIIERTSLLFIYRVISVSPGLVVRGSLGMKSIGPRIHANLQFCDGEVTDQPNQLLEWTVKRS